MIVEPVLKAPNKREANGQQIDTHEEPRNSLLASLWRPIYTP